jgi:hypothetical protein
MNAMIRTSVLGATRRGESRSVETATYPRIVTWTVAYGVNPTSFHRAAAS